MADAFQKGWSYYAKAASAGETANAGQQYCVNVQSAIDAFTEEMQSMVEQHGNLGVKQEITMQTTRLQKQHRITRSSQPMGFDFLRAIWGLFADNMGLECPKQSIINLSISANREGKYYATIRQPRCRNGG